VIDGDPGKGQVSAADQAHTRAIGVVKVAQRLGDELEVGLVARRADPADHERPVRQRKNGIPSDIYGGRQLDHPRRMRRFRPVGEPRMESPNPI
jgi:hypothetical protein